MRHAAKRAAGLGALILVFVLPLLPAWFAAAQNRAGNAPRRAAAPDFEPSDYRDIFFDNVFTEGGPLVGTRPDSGTSVVARPAPASPASPAAGGAAPAGEGIWAELISPTTIEDEIKALNLQLEQSVTTPAQFAGRGHKDVQKQFSLLAMLFAIIGDYGADVRWKEDAPELRDRFARAAANTKAGGNIQVYNEAKMRKEDLANVVRGSRLNEGNADPEVNWESTVYRSPLMRILEDRSARYLQQATASEDAFSKEPEKVLHEAELVAAIAGVLKQEGMDDAGDSEYVALVDRMKQAAQDVVSAVKLNNAEQARLAVGEISQSCSACHDAYR